MAKLMKDMVRPYAGLFAIALVIALLGRIGLWVMDMTGAIAYDYISASGWLFSTSSAPSSPDTRLSHSSSPDRWRSRFRRRVSARIPDAQGEAFRLIRHGFLWGWATAFVALVCLMIVANGILSGVQVRMSSRCRGFHA
ncbi:MAG: hypothetical protein ACLTQI_03645 [Slackia sp.]